MHTATKEKEICLIKAKSSLYKKSIQSFNGKKGALVLFKELPLGTHFSQNSLQFLNSSFRVAISELILF